VTGGNHEPFYQQKYIANALALPLDRVRVIMPPTAARLAATGPMALHRQSR